MSRTDHPDAHLWRGLGVRGAFVRRFCLNLDIGPVVHAPYEIKALTLWVREQCDPRTSEELWKADPSIHYEWQAVSACQSQIGRWLAHKDDEELAYELGGVLAFLIKKRREWLVLSPGTDAKT